MWSLPVMIHVGNLEVGGVVISSDDPRRYIVWKLGVWSLAVMIHIGSLEVGCMVSSDDPYW